MPPEIFQKLQIAEAQSARKYVGSDTGGWHLPGSQARGGTARKGLRVVSPCPAVGC